jgi:catechol 2,3-dioxygenase-like lactoylglutathione lyase family enzyme
VSEVAPFPKVGAVILLVSDMEESVKFYRDVLHLPIKGQSEGWTEFFNTGTVIALHPKKKIRVSPGPAGGILVGFMVNDLDATVSRLKQQKVKFFKEPKDEAFGKHAIIEDPDGHLISIAQIESKSAEGFDLIGFLGTD